MSKIAIFDSGCGGLSVFKEIYRLLPNEEYIYWCDNAYCPYGGKSKEYILDRSRTITKALIEKGADIIVIACNTATSVAVAHLRKEFPIKFIGMEPAIKPASLQTKTGVIGVLATESTLNGSKYKRHRALYENSTKIVEQVGKGWVELVEGGHPINDEALEIIKQSLMPLINAGADKIVLGCTHYPFLKKPITKIVGEGVDVIDPAPAVARHLVNVMAKEGLLDVEDAKRIVKSSLKGCYDSKNYLSTLPPPKIDVIFSGKRSLVFYRLLSKILK